ncbi:MAG: ABC transporter ATP-binding protein [Leadbetterella sp.]
MIEIKNISKTFGERKVLDNVSGVFKKGDTSLVIGASGTGKSVLLKCMLDLVEPDTGGVFYDGREFLQKTEVERQAIRRDMGVLFQGGALFDSMTVEQNVRFPLNMMTKMSDEEKNDRVNFCLQKVGLENAGSRKPSEISGGMKKRVGIARAIVMNPKYLFCDEPNSGLDPLTSIKIDELIKQITDDFDITTVIITHDMNSVLSIGDNIKFLYKGQKLWEGSSKTILQAEIQELEEFVFTNQALKQLRKSQS